MLLSSLHCLVGMSSDDDDVTMTSSIIPDNDRVKKLNLPTKAQRSSTRSSRHFAGKLFISMLYCIHSIICQMYSVMYSVMCVVY